MKCLFDETTVLGSTRFELKFSYLWGLMKCKDDINLILVPVVTTCFFYTKKYWSISWCSRLRENCAKITSLWFEYLIHGCLFDWNTHLCDFFVDTAHVLVAEKTEKKFQMRLKPYEDIFSHFIQCCPFQPIVIATIMYQFRLNIPWGTSSRL